MKKVILIFALVFIVMQMCLPLVSAIPPQVSKAELGYELRVPQAEFLMEGRNVYSHIHIFNVSTGMPVYPSNSNVNCILHLYNQTGSHVLEQTMGEHDNGLEWKLFIDGGNLTQIGLMSFLIYCNDSLSGGFVSSSFEITGTGQEFNEPKAILSIGLLAVIVFLFVITVKGINQLPSGDNYDDEEKLLSINHLKYLRPILCMVVWFLIISLVYIGSNIAFAYMGTELLASILFAIFKIMFALSLPIIVVWFCYIFYSIFQDRKMKEYIDRGIMT